MQLDHVIYVADTSGLDATVARLGAATGVEPVEGGVHTTFGTYNALLPLGGMQYVEVVALHEPGAAAASPFGSAVAARSAAGGGWLGWAVAVEDPGPVAARLARPLIPGGRRRPDGVELAWRQVGTDVLTADPLLPFFLTWDVPPALHPSADRPSGAADRPSGPTGPSGADGAVRIAALELAGDASDRERLSTWLDADRSTADRCAPLSVRLDWSPLDADHPVPGLVAVQVETPTGTVRLD